jgi:hypothetical protein
MHLILQKMMKKVLMPELDRNKFYVPFKRLF